MAWGETYSASGTYANTAGATAAVTAAFNIALPGIPSGAIGTFVLTPTSGAAVSGAISGITATGLHFNCPAQSSGQVHAIFGHSIIA